MRFCRVTRDDRCLNCRWTCDTGVLLPRPLTSDLALLLQIYHKHSVHFSVETNDARELVDNAAGEIEILLANRAEALKVSVTPPFT